MSFDANYSAMFAAAVLERVFPIVPSYFMYPAAGATVTTQASLLALIAVATAGSLAGALSWYLAGMALGEARGARLAQRFGRYAYLDASRFEQLLRAYRNRPVMILILGQLVPGVRIVQLLPAGIARLPLRLVAMCTAIGSLCWITPLAVAGYLLAETGWAMHSIGLAILSVLLIVELSAAYLVALRKRRTKFQSNSNASAQA